MEALTMKHLYQGTDGDRGYFKLANVLHIGSKSTVMLSDKARLRRGGRIGHVKFYHTIALCHRGID
jgi:predicted transposase YbfD/YdcC